MFTIGCMKIKLVSSIIAFFLSTQNAFAESTAISAINVTNVLPTSALVSWTTSTATTSILYLGISSGNYSATFRASEPSDNGLINSYDLTYARTAHSTYLTDLKPDTHYFMLVEAM